MRPWLYRITLNAALDAPVRHETAGTRSRVDSRSISARRSYCARLRLSVKENAAELGLTTAGVQQAPLLPAAGSPKPVPPARHRPVSAKPPASGRRSCVLAVLAAGAALVALCVGVPIAATVTPAEAGDPPTLAVPPASRAL